MIVKENTTLDKDKKEFETIPQPPTKMLVGNLLDVMGRTPTQDIIKLAREYGPIIQLDLPGR
ncbi:MAG TPA: hypothetical protein VII61_05835, partial [Ktedonobacteraceae bacterium]